MRNIINTFYLFCFLILGIGCNSNKDKNNNLYMDDDSIQISQEKAHPNAKQLLNESFYWDIIDQTAPFGNDEGNDTFYDYIEWEKRNGKGNILDFLKFEINNSGFPHFDILTLDSTYIKDYVAKNSKLGETEINELKNVLQENSDNLPKNKNNGVDFEKFNETLVAATNDMGLTYINSIDNIIISSGFSQIIIDGTIDSDLKKLVSLALKREMEPYLLNRWDENYSKIRKEKLEKMIIKINSID